MMQRSLGPFLSTAFLASLLAFASPAVASPAPEDSASPAAAATASAASPASAGAGDAAPLVVPAAGFAHDGDASVLTGTWTKTVGTSPHVVIVKQQSDPSFATFGTDIAAFGPSMVTRFKTDGYTVIDSQPKALCRGAKGYEIHVKEKTDGGTPLDEFLLLGVSHSNLYEVVYTHEAASAVLPEALAFLDSLCPP